MIQFDSNTIGNTAPVREWIVSMEQALLDTASGKLHVPPRTHIDHGRNTLLLMPCFGNGYFSTKLVSVFPENLNKKLPVIYGSVVLNDGSTGKPLAILDGAKLTAMRTAAVGSIGIKYLAPPEAKNLGIIGLGIQGFHQALFACETRPIRELRILDRSREIMDRFSKRFKAFFKEVKVIPCRTTLELCLGSDIIITATGSRHAVVPDRGDWWKGKTLIGIGSYKAEMREYPDGIMAGLDQVFVDTTLASMESGDLFHPLERGLIKQEQVIDISELISGTCAPMGETRFFKSVGMAAFDLYGAKLVYEKQV